MIDKFLELGNKYAQKSDWKDFALVKFCLCSMGIIIGTFIPEKQKKNTRLISLGVFSVTYTVLMTGVLRLLKKGE